VNVAGRIRAGADPRTFYRRVAQPSLFLGYTLKQLLERRGIAIGAVKVGKSPAQGLRVLAAHAAGRHGNEHERRDNSAHARSVPLQADVHRPAEAGRYVIVLPRHASGPD